jgi:hypothetical protein
MKANLLNYSLQSAALIRSPQIRSRGYVRFKNRCVKKNLPTSKNELKMFILKCSESIKRTQSDPGIFHLSDMLQDENEEIVEDRTQTWDAGFYRYAS